MIVMIIINVRLIQRKIVFGIMESRVIQDWEKLQTHHHKLCIVGLFFNGRPCNLSGWSAASRGPPNNPPINSCSGGLRHKKITWRPYHEWLEDYFPLKITVIFRKFILNGQIPRCAPQHSWSARSTGSWRSPASASPGPGRFQNGVRIPSEIVGEVLISCLYINKLHRTQLKMTFSPEKWMRRFSCWNITILWVSFREFEGVTSPFRNFFNTWNRRKSC